MLAGKVMTSRQAPALPVPAVEAGSWAYQAAFWGVALLLFLPPYFRGLFFATDQQRALILAAVVFWLVFPGCCTWSISLRWGRRWPVWPRRRGETDGCCLGLDFRGADGRAAAPGRLVFSVGARA